jgi:hypothetical protein
MMTSDLSPDLNPYSLLTRYFTPAEDPRHG